MPVPIESYIQPSFIKYRERYPMSYDKRDRFINTVPQKSEMARHNGDTDTGNGWKQPGYNPNSNSTRVERVNIYTDNISLRPY
jgi:hypothetical protein